MNWKACWILPVLLPAALAGEVQNVLDREGLVVVDKPLTQGFSAYVGPEHPIFVTSDSLLMAYHRLFEEQVAQEELANLAGHLKFWPDLWGKLPAEPLSDEATDQEGLRRNRLVVATALRLLTGTLPQGLADPEVAEVKREVGRVEEGEGNTPPTWIYPASDDVPFVSYAAFRPGSLHEGIGALERYYRFRKWLQEMPLDLENPATASMAEHLGFALAGMEIDPLVYQVQPLFRGQSCLFATLLQDAWRKVEPGRLEAWRTELREKFSEYRDWRFLDSLVPPGSEITRELLPSGNAEWTPEILGAVLGNPVAISLLGPEHQVALAFGRKSLEDSWGISNALRSLNAPPDPRAPDLLRSEAWQRKQLNTSLGSWAEYRHALQLASREDATLRGGADLLPGFVEPVPDFYHDLGVSAGAMIRSRDSKRESSGMAELKFALQLEKLAGHLERAETYRREDDPQSVGMNSDYVQVSRHGELLNRLFPKPLSDDDFETTWDWVEADQRAAVQTRLDAFLRRFWGGDEKVVRTVRTESTALKDDLSPRLGLLAATCFRLEAMAERQLSGQPWRESDIGFLEVYGMHLAWLMFHEGNSYLSPDDDAPRIARYATDASPTETRVHHAAVARPRLLMIRYPDQDGKMVLCQGAVYAFRNVERDQTPTRDEWKTEADRSPWPGWMDAITATPEPTAGN